MLWPVRLDNETVQESANLVLEGTVAFAYEDFIPGVQPRTKGVHWLLGSDSKLVKADAVGRAIYAEVPHSGFWTYRGFISGKVGDHVRVSLLLHENLDGLLTLMPHGCSAYSVIDSRSGKTKLIEMAHPAEPNTPGDECPSQNFPALGRLDQLPLRFGCFATDRMAGYTSYMDIAGTEWEYGIGDNWFQSVVWLTPADVRSHPVHFVPRWVPYIAPSSPSRPQPLAWTKTNSGGIVARLGGNNEMLFNQSYAWSYDNTPASNEFDFLSVMMHEMGHALGLDHQNVFIAGPGGPPNVMHCSIAPGTMIRSKRFQDSIAIIDAYRGDFPLNFRFASEGHPSEDDLLAAIKDSPVQKGADKRFKANILK